MQEGGYHTKNGAKSSAIMRGSGTEAGEDFPMLCETCLGQNPYVRMVKLPFGQKLCSVSKAPYQAFRWKAGPKGRYKETVISFIIAREKNICQACLNDMQYGLPVGVRDSVLNQEQGKIEMPTSDVGQRYHYEEKARSESNVAPSNSVAMGLSNVGQSNQLRTFSQIHHAREANKTAFRNLPKLCSFWVGGGCLRVKRKSCPFRPCCGTYVFPELAATHKELMTSLIAQLEKDGPEKTQTNISDEIRVALKNSSKGNKEESIRKRVHGDDNLSKKYVGKINSMKGITLQPPDDPTITTLWLGNLAPDTTQHDIRDIFYAYGHIKSVHVIPQSKCAFVEYDDRAAAEYAASQLYNNCTMKGHNISIGWAKPKLQGSGSVNSESISQDSVMLPPGVLTQHDLSAHIRLTPAPPNISYPGSSCLPHGMNPTLDFQHPRKKARPATQTYASMDPSQLGSKY